MTYLGEDGERSMLKSCYWKGMQVRDPKRNLLNELISVFYITEFSKSLLREKEARF
jgi:hypothetical protein